jgi:hypothetical protein
MPVSAFVVAATVTLVVASPQDWSHSWSTALESQFIDYGYQTLTQQKAQFVATHYQIASFEKCTGPGPTEPNVWATAAQIKALNPSLKAMFYWDVDQTALSCYDAYNVFMANPSWWLRDDNGHVVNSSSGQPIMDYTNPAGMNRLGTIVKGRGECAGFIFKYGTQPTPSIRMHAALQPTRSNYSPRLVGECTAERNGQPGVASD